MSATPRQPTHIEEITGYKPGTPEYEAEVERRLQARLDELHDDDPFSEYKAKHGLSHGRGGSTRT